VYFYAQSGREKTFCPAVLKCPALVVRVWHGDMLQRVWLSFRKTIQTVPERSKWAFWIGTKH